MFCTVALAGLLCTTAPPNDIRDRMLYRRIEISRYSDTFNYAVPVALYTEPAPAPEPDPVPRQVVEMPSKAVATGAVKAAHEDAAAGKPSFLARLFGVRSATAKSVGLPKVTGVNLNKPGYKAVYIAAKKHGVDPNLALRMAKQESGGNCKARSSANARGVLQVIPSTARPHGVSASQLYNCRLGAEAGVKEIKRLQVMYRGDLKKVLTGYNCGVGCVQKGRMPRETRNYIRIIGGGKV